MSSAETSSGVSDSQSAHGSTLAAISRRMVGLIKDYYGKGPTNARTYHWGELVVVLLSGGSTSVEKTLIADGQEQAVIDQRTAFQDAMRPRYKRVIEEEMHREVVAHRAHFTVVLLAKDSPAIAHYRVRLPERGIDVVDCGGVTSGDQVVPGEGHPNGRMNAIWADCLATKLQELLPETKVVPPL